MLHTFRHLLDPGTPSYTALKLSAVAGAVGLQVAVRRRGGHRDGDGEAREHASAEQAQSHAARRPHPRSKKKRRRRR